MAKKKSEIYSSLWESCNKLRGGMDSSQYKDYILILLFVKYISDKVKIDKDSLIVVPKGASFDDMVKLKNQKNIGDEMNKIITEIAKANDLHEVTKDADFNDETKLGKGKEMVDRLTGLIAIFESDDLDFTKNTAQGDDILGDAYEYLMSHFATESGKSKGQFYTPAEVSRIMAKVIGVSDSKSPSDSIYDPTCGSGSLLLKVADEAPHGISIYGQEKDNATSNLAKMNMILHNHATAEIHQDNTLSNPFFKDNETTVKTFNYVVANPPFSFKSWRDGFTPSADIYGRFDGYGIPPAKNGDYAFMLHILKSLKSTGKGAVILPHGVLFRGNVEAQIRTEVIKKRFIKGIIALPPNLFFGTGIPACIIVLDKEYAETRQGIFMIDAGKGFIKDGNKNRLREQDIRKIVDTFNNQLEIPKYSKMVGFDAIEKNEYNLNIPRYINSQETEDIQDIEAHLNGGIPNFDVENLNKYWDVYPALKSELFKPLRDRYSSLNISKEDVKTTIYNNREFIEFSKLFNKLFEDWKTNNIESLKNIEVATKPKRLIPTLANNMIDTYRNTKLIDKYDIYQHLMTYWNDVMQDDVYILSRIGWKIELIEVKVDKKKTKMMCDLVPANLVVNRYFKSEKQSIEKFDQQLESVISSKEELLEEHSGDEGILESLKNDAGNVSKAVAQAELKTLKKQQDNDEEIKVIEQYIAYLEKEAALKKSIKDANDALDKKVLQKYKELSVDEIKTLVIEDKWMASIYTKIETEMSNISQNLTLRIKELTDRYSIPLPQLENDIQVLSKRVNAHLEKMGFACV